MFKVGLLLYDYTLYGGAEKVALNMANELVKYYDVHVISCFAQKKNPIRDIDDKVRCFIISKSTKSLSFHALELSRKLKHYLQENQLDCIINITAGINSISFLATKNIDTKVIYAEHSNLLNQTYGRKHLFRQWLGAKTADRVITLTNQDKKMFSEKFGITHKCDCIYNWYNGEICSSQYDSNSKKIISVGRLVTVKGYDRLIEAAKKVFIKHPDWIWDIYGEGDLRKELEEQIKVNGLHNNVFLRGNRSDIMQLYKEYAFLVMTSYYEGLPLSLLEAKSCLLPIISFNCPTGPEEIVRDGLDGMLIENGNTDQLAEGINHLIEDQKLREDFSSNSLGNMKMFEKDTIVDKWINIIDDLCVGED